MTTEDLIMNHRSVRKFRSEAVPTDMLNRIVNCGLRASNTGNMQLYSIIATTRQPLLGELCKLHYGQCATAPLMLTLCVDVNRYHHWCRLRGCDEPYGNFLWLMSATVDAALAAQNMCLAAEEEGLGFCFLGTVMYNTKAIAELLRLPAGVVPVAALALGHPDEHPPKSERLEPEGVLHWETYHDYSDEEIEQVHRVRETFPFNQEMVRQNKVRNLAELFTAIRYPRKNNETISQAYLEFCEQAGFLPKQSHKE
ncbi:MAG: nitroreductase family protein [Bacteroidales bacterium]|nr:nitroreductase family protein [Bacteroidales bacterium]